MGNKENGVLHITELEADKHAASGRRILATDDATFRIRFSMGPETKAFHPGFDPARGEFEKKGHLYSIIVMPDQWRIVKHVDKNRPREDPNEILAQKPHEFQPSQWDELEIECEGENIIARIETIGELSASHPTFSVKRKETNHHFPSRRRNDESR